MLAIDLQHLTKRYGAVTAVDNLSREVAPGEIVAFLGPNGAGNTTTIDIMLGLARPDHGSVAVYGKSPADAIARRAVAAVMQTGGVLKDFKVRETVAYTASLYAHARPEHEVLERAGIVHTVERLLGKCSGGEQQRLRFAMALLSARSHARRSREAQRRGPSRASYAGRLSSALARCCAFAATRPACRRRRSDHHGRCVASAESRPTTPRLNSCPVRACPATPHAPEM